ncbi:hypothetical protein [Parasedimentitalea psychrophila]|uniref:Sulfotransferase domain-containing protein n=1 Tax=Parasedimentitalea psychrophila TaxID=2997337 RepID=A0A9Y2L1H4_9RHOB|nr:hypothetical protein [Parasedimentitalea psychrophila]WIY26304.1 hypothetical protein QPJ95_05100 [Parasedimentitalea psychrophila]
MTEIILHIGTPKTGTTAIQSAIVANSDALQAADIWFVESGRHRAAHNDLANSIRRKGGDHNFNEALQQEIAAQAAKRPNGKILLSSEIFSLIEASKIRAALPFLSDYPLKIIVYLRRQDRYAEAFFKQRIKNGRNVMPFDQFLTSRLGRSITDYNRLLDGWADCFPQAEIMPRLYQRDRFVNGDIMADFAALLGLEPGHLVASAAERNISPSKDVIDVLLALSPHLDGRQLRSIYRALKPLQLDGFTGSGDLFTRQTRQDYLDQFLAANDQLQKAYFPNDGPLFSPDDPNRDKPLTSGFSPVQQTLLAAALNEAFKLHQKTTD